MNVGVPLAAAIVGNGWWCLAAALVINVSVFVGGVYVITREDDLPDDNAARVERVLGAALAEAWDQGWWKGQHDTDPTLIGYALNPYRTSETEEG